MNIEQFRDHCLAKKGVTETFPFDETTLVFKVMNKMFALCGIDDEEPRINLKCDPERALDLRDRYDAVIPGYHMNKTHWNSVYLDSDLTDAQIYDLIDHSYELIVESLKPALREAWKQL